MTVVVIMIVVAGLVFAEYTLSYLHFIANRIGTY